MKKGGEYMKPMYAVLIAVVVGAVGFFGGMQYQKSQANPLLGATGFGRMQQYGQGGQGRFFTGSGGRSGGGRVVGSILNIDTNSMTVKLPDGSTKIVILSGTTSFSKAAVGSVTDLKTGDNVAVFGTANADGSVTAQNIQIGGQLMQRGGGTPPTGSPSGSPQP